jgi:hypothetical protein
MALLRVSEMRRCNEALEVVLNCLDKGIFKDVGGAIKVDTGIFAWLAFRRREDAPAGISTAVSVPPEPFIVTIMDQEWREWWET